MLSVHSSPLGELGTKDTGGMSIYIREMASELGRMGHLVDIYTRGQQRSSKRIEYISHNVSLIHIPAGGSSYLEKLDLYPFLPEFFQNMEEFRIHEDRQYDIVHSNYWLSGRVGSWAQVCWHVPHFALFHTLGSVKNLTSVGDPEPELRIAVETLIAKTCTRIIAETERERTQLIELYNADADKIAVVPCGVNNGLFHPLDKKQCRDQLGLDNNELLLLCVGRINPLKGIDRLITAFSYLQNYPRLRLLIVGGEHSESAYFRSLRRLSESFGLTGRITFAGRSEYQNLPLYYSAADGLVLPSHTESFGLVGLEALACGTPVVATRVGAMEQIISSSNNGYLVDIAEPHLLAQGIERLICALDAGQFSRTIIRKSVQSYRWSRVAQVMANAYAAAIQNANFRFQPEPIYQAQPSLS